MKRLAIVASLWLTVVLTGRAEVPETPLRDLVAQSDAIVVARVEENGRTRVLETWKGSAADVTAFGEPGDMAVLFLESGDPRVMIRIVNGELEVSDEVLDARPGTVDGLRSLVRAAT